VHIVQPDAVVVNVLHEAIELRACALPDLLYQRDC
jgi:hypothetical protein